ncbi:hypothetical protein Tco_0391912, partial [Tanacetum coccineum]
MARQCPKPKRKRDATWFRDKVLLVEVERIFKKRTKRKPKANKSEHGMERTKS